MKVLQPYRSPGEADCFIKGVMACADLFGHKVDSTAFGGGVPVDLTLYKPEEVKRKVVEVDEETKYIMTDVTSEVSPDGSEEAE